MKVILFLIPALLCAQNARRFPPSRLGAGGATSNQCLAWLGQQWGPSVCVTTTGVSQSFSSQTSISITHNYGTRNIDVGCFDATNKYFKEKDWTATSINAVTINFDSAKTGRCIVK